VTDAAAYWHDLLQCSGVPGLTRQIVDLAFMKMFSHRAHRTDVAPVECIDAMVGGAAEDPASGCVAFDDAAAWDFPAGDDRFPFSAAGSVVVAEDTRFIGRVVDVTYPNISVSVIISVSAPTQSTALPDSAPPTPTQ
jgi:hypothetical protein